MRRPRLRAVGPWRFCAALSSLRRRRGGGEVNQYFFVVPVDADKREIASAVEQLFKVRVVAVNTLRQRGKVKRFRGVVGQRAESKKAMVTVAEGQVIDLAGGIG